LREIKVKNKAFLDTRRDDPTVKAREHTLQSLDLAYHKYCEIVRHLREGQEFYNGLSGILADFREQCKEWARSRQAEIDALTRTMQNISIQSPPEGRAVLESISTPSSPTIQEQQQSFPAAPANFLPPPDSEEWEEMELPAGPPADRRPLPSY